MKRLSRFLLLVLFILLILLIQVFASGHKIAGFAWIEKGSKWNTIEESIEPPPGFRRMYLIAGSFPEWLRNLPVHPPRKLVRLYNGFPKINQFAHHRVLDIDVDKYDLQQCADAVIRLRAEFLFWSREYDKIHFNFTSGDKCSWNDWKNGIRPVVNGNSVSFVKKAEVDTSYKNFRQYLLKVFTYAGSASLSRELRKIGKNEIIAPGDVFIQGGYPGHAVIIVDMAVNETTGEKLMLLAQSYMPAQEIHILKNHQDNKLSPWFKVEIDKPLDTPEWDFPANSLKGFPLEGRDWGI